MGGLSRKESARRQNGPWSKGDIRMKIGLGAAILAALSALALVLCQGGGLSAQVSGATSGNREVAGGLLAATKVTQGQLQVIDKDGKAVGQCPLKHTSVQAQIAGFVARVDVTQEFVNPTADKIEAVYVFPLPQDAAVDRMEMTVGDRTIRGEIKRREEARQIYEAAKQAGHVASLLDQERPNVFTQSVANIMPGERVLIKISYVDLLNYENGQYEFTFPMVVGPRYIPGQPIGKSGEGWAPDTTKVPDASKITPPVTPEGTRAGHDISVEVRINAGVPIGEISSVLHEVDIERPSESEARVALTDQETIPNKDFILRYQVAGDMVQTGLLPSTRSAGDGYLSLILVPPKAPGRILIAPKEMVFVIDSSGSQMGWPIEKSKETMKLCIEQMNPGDTFQMLAFSNEVIPLFDKPQPNTPENRALVQEFLASRLGGGGTEMMKAITAALTPPPDPRRLRIVCFMTDGYVGNDLEILDAVKKNIGSARLFSFGIGNAPNRFLLDGMADLGRGAVEYVTLAEKGSLAAEKFHERISKPILTDISIDWGGLPVDDVYPKRIPDLFSSQPVILKGRYVGSAEGTITIHGKLGGKPWSEEVPVTLPNEEDENKALPSLWARAKIADLTAQDYLGLQRGDADPNVKEQVTRLALEYQLMSQFTSFVAVEEKIVTEGGQPKKVAVPVEMPEGVSYEGVFDSMKLAAVYGGFATNAAAGLAPPAAPVAGMVPRQTGSTSVAGVAFKAGRLDLEASGKEEAVLDEAKLRGKTPAERRKTLIEAHLDPALRGIAKKLDKGGNYYVPRRVLVRNRKVLVSIRLVDDSVPKLAQLKRLGFEQTAASGSLRMVVGRVPVGKLEELAQLLFVIRITPVL